jgi:hypothetical protein
MKSSTLELFWVEKIKLTQNTINLTRNLNDEQLDFPNDVARLSIRKALQKMQINDQKFATYLPFAIRFGNLFPLPKVSQVEIEQELTMIRDLFQAPALPPKLSEIIVRSADEIEFSECNPSLENIFKPWKQAIGHQEMHVEKISEEDSYKYRYFSWKGIYIIPAAINMVAMENHFLLKDGILKFLKDPNFPK